MPNANGGGYFRYHLSAPLQQSLTESFDALDAREQRVYADSLMAGFKKGSLTSAQYLAALPRLVGAKAQETVTSTLGDVRWMWEQLIDEESQRAAFRAKVADIYRPLLQQLGMDQKPGESDEDRKLREILVREFGFRLKDPVVRRLLAAHGRTVLGLDGDGKLHEDAVSRDLRGIALVVATQDGGSAAFDLAEKHLLASADPTLRSELLTAMGLVEDGALAVRLRALALTPDRIHPSEIGIIVQVQTMVPALRAGIRDWLSKNFDALRADVGPMIGMGAIYVESAGACDTASASRLQSRYADRVRELDGGPMALKQAVERIGLCAALKKAHRGEPL
ncbi:MAG: ERAP1-like C-terminal domain-containing protein, partial [Dokdonella sp.]